MVSLQIGIPKGQYKIDNPGKLATQSTQYEDEKTTQHVLDTTMRKQTQHRQRK